MREVWFVGKDDKSLRSVAHDRKTGVHGRVRLLEEVRNWMVPLLAVRFFRRDLKFNNNKKM